MRNNQKYGARVLPPPPPAVEIVISDNPPSTASSSGSTITKAPFIPTIRAPEDNSRPPVPTISLPDGDEGKKGTKSAPPVPSISLPGEPSSSASAEPPVPTPPASWRPLPTPRAFPKPPSSNYSSSSSTGCGPTVSCTYCRIPIWSRLVCASSFRFHLECFRAIVATLASNTWGSSRNLRRAAESVRKLSRTIRVLRLLSLPWPPTECNFTAI
ncbi:hypothetical protein B9Z19DRAFT_86976 [Tuber borchii]|uniref:Uncharacterized protein n=1 Tax=Tuber borchii TaxID=42251 RepID=A0A2T6ZS73_TUBBO|nr:hypothetical protein B9Z19DRAFT_86976 [Tuber borchii]